MKIIILGAGQVGSSLAASLVSEDNDITVVDTDAAKLAFSEWNTEKAKAKVGPCSAHAFQPADDLPPAA